MVDPDSYRDRDQMDANTPSLIALSSPDAIGSDKELNEKFTIAAV